MSATTDGGASGAGALPGSAASLPARNSTGAPPAPLTSSGISLKKPASP